MSNKVAKILKKKKFVIKKIDGDLFRKKNKIKKFNKTEIIKNNLSIIRYIDQIKHKYDYLIISVISPLKKLEIMLIKNLEVIILKFTQNAI